MLCRFLLAPLSLAYWQRNGFGNYEKASRSWAGNTLREAIFMIFPLPMLVSSKRRTES